MTKPLALIIEDDPTLGEVFALSLKNDFETEIIANGDEALSRLAKVKPALMVLDLHLPGASGFDVFLRVRSDSRLTDMHIILCTADARQAETLRDEADVILLKPVSPIQLRALASRFHHNS